MSFLNNQILALNTKLEAGIITVTPKLSAGIVWQVIHKGKKKANKDTNGNIVHFDDRFGVYFYHKIQSESADIIPSRGNGLKNIHSLRTSMRLIVFSKVDSSDYFKSRLQETADIEITNVDYDSYKIFEEETELTEYRFDKYFIFAIDYIYKHKVRECQTL